MSAIKINIIVAVDDEMGIGVNGQLPWHLKRDLAYFKKVTTSRMRPEKRNAVIMGKNTWLSIPGRFRPLSDRINVVLSTQLRETPIGAHLAGSFEKAIEILDNLDVETVFVIGGASVYEEAMQRANLCKIYVTRIYGNFACDTFFPRIDDKTFYKVSPASETFEENGIKYAFEIYEQIPDNIGQVMNNLLGAGAHGQSF